MTSERLIQVLEDAGFEPRSYSGRAMYGAHCVGVVVPPSASASVGAKAVLAAAQAAIGYGVNEEAADWDEAEAVAELMERTSRDSMGRDVILYWEEMAWPDGQKGDRR